MLDTFKSIDYLAKGNDIQKKAYCCIVDLRLFEILKQFNPLLAGTIPININIENSDLDIICECSNTDLFYQFLTDKFSSHSSFCISRQTVRDVDSVIASFESNGFCIEIFGQNCPSHLQNAYLHLLAENKVLQEKGEAFRQEIISLKLLGYKTEPAFAKALHLNGDPYDAILKLL